VALDINGHALFGGPIFTEGETGYCTLRLQFLRTQYKNYARSVSTVPSNGFPNTYFVGCRFCPGWLSKALRLQDLGSRINNIVPPIKPAGCPTLPAATIHNNQSSCWDTFRSVFDRARKLRSILSENGRTCRVVLSV